MHLGVQERRILPSPYSMVMCVRETVTLLMAGLAMCVFFHSRLSQEQLKRGKVCFGSCVQGKSVHGSTEGTVKWLHLRQECEVDAVLRLADRGTDRSRGFRV